MNNKEIIINPSKSKKISYVLVFAIVALVYLVMMRVNWITRELGIMLIAFCACVCIYFSYSLFFPRASIVVNQEGIKDKVIRGKGLIKWDKISEIYICVIPKKKYDTYFLGIKYRKDENDKRKVKFKGKVNEKVGDTVLTLDELEMEPYDIYNNIQKYYSKFIRK
ncbi:STM3941 family protein [Intestinibacter sp.]